MAVMITLTYNPYVPQLRVLIDGKHPPEYSCLIQYADEDIWIWHNKILNMIYSELRDDFYIRFIGSPLDAEILKYHCNIHENCIGFEVVEFVIKDSLQKRLGTLNQFLKKNDIVSYTRTIFDALFVIPQNMQMYMEDIASIDINNLFCSTYVRIFNEKDRKFDNTANAYLFVLSLDVSEGLELISKFNSMNPIFLIYVGKRTKIIQVTDTVVVCETTENNLISTIFNCFLWLPLVKAFRACYSSVQKSLGQIDTLKKIIAVDPIIKISVETKLEVGKSNPIRVTFEPPVKFPPRISFKVLNEMIASTDDIAIYGKQVGSTKLEAYYYGSRKPFETFIIEVFKRNRIKKLILSDDELVLGIGDTKRIYCDYSPVDADNVQSITWSSTDESVVSVEKNGLLKCHNEGICRIICTAENVSAQCQCKVKPYLQEIKITLPDDKDTLTLEPMQEYDLPIIVTPNDSIDSQLLISSSDYNIANVIGNKIIAKNAGEAIITISNVTKRKTIRFSIVVAKKKISFFKALIGH